MSRYNQYKRDPDKKSHMRKLYIARRIALVTILFIVFSVTILMIEPLDYTAAKEGGQETASPGVSGTKSSNMHNSVSTFTSSPILTTSIQPTPPYNSDSVVILEVPLVKQMPELPAGCEITSVTMMLLYAGNNVNKIDLAREMPRHESNVNKGFVGDPFHPVGNINTIFPPALMNLVAQYAGKAVNMTGVGMTGLRSQIKAGYPVVTWINIAEINGLHCVCVYGYDKDNVYYNDPLYGEKVMSSKDFLETWTLQKQRAISYTAR